MVGSQLIYTHLHEKIKIIPNIDIAIASSKNYCFTIKLIFEK